MFSRDLSAKEFIHELCWWQDLNCMWTFGFTNITIWFWYKFWNYTILWYRINTHLLTNFTSISRESSQTQTFSSVLVTDLVRSSIIEAIASCGKLRTKSYNQGYNILCNLKNYKKSSGTRYLIAKLANFNFLAYIWSHLPRFPWKFKSWAGKLLKFWGSNPSSGRSKSFCSYFFLFSNSSLKPGYLWI